MRLELFAKITPIKIKIFDEYARDRIADIDRRNLYLRPICDYRAIDNILHPRSKIDRYLVAGKRRFPDLCLKPIMAGGQSFDQPVMFDPAGGFQFELRLSPQFFVIKVCDRAASAVAGKARDTSVRVDYLAS